MPENYFWGKAGIQINALMAGTAWNLQNRWKNSGKDFFLLFFDWFFSQYLSRFAI
jgi:hypothetical protein